MNALRGKSAPTELVVACTTKPLSVVLPLGVGALGDGGSFPTSWCRLLSRLFLDVELLLKNHRFLDVFLFILLELVFVGVQQLISITYASAILAKVEAELKLVSLGYLSHNCLSYIMKFSLINYIICPKKKLKMNLPPRQKVQSTNLLEGDKVFP